MKFLLLAFVIPLAVALCPANENFYVEMGNALTSTASKFSYSASTTMTLAQLKAIFPLFMAATKDYVNGYTINVNLGWSNANYYQIQFCPALFSSLPQCVKAAANGYNWLGYARNDDVLGTQQRLVWQLDDNGAVVEGDGAMGEIYTEGGAPYNCTTRPWWTVADAALSPSFTFASGGTGYAWVRHHPTQVDAKFSVNVWDAAPCPTLECLTHSSARAGVEALAAQDLSARTRATNFALILRVIKGFTEPSRFLQLYFSPRRNGTEAAFWLVQNCENAVSWNNTLCVQTRAAGYKWLGHEMNYAVNNDYFRRQYMLTEEGVIVGDPLSATATEYHPEVRPWYTLRWGWTVQYAAASGGFTTQSYVLATANSVIAADRGDNEVCTKLTPNGATHVLVSGLAVLFTVLAALFL